MKRFTFLFAVATCGLSFASHAQQSDSGYSEYNSERKYWYGRQGERRWDEFVEREEKPLYYRPTMRYYGNGYTVNYRYIPVYAFHEENLHALGGASNFRTEAFLIDTDDIKNWGATSPRVTVKDPHSAASHAPVTTIIRKTSTAKKTGKGAPVDAAPAGAPAIAPTPAVAPAPVAAPTPDAAPVQPKP